MSSRGEAIEAQVWKLVKNHLENATSEELHIYAARSNYDGNESGIKLLVDNPKLDRATALLLFWYLGADYYARYLAEEVPDFQRPKDKLVRLIEKRYTSNFYTESNIYYDPKNSYLYPDEYSSIGPIKRKIPEIMYLPTDGRVEVDLNDENYDNGLPLPIVDKIFTLYG